MRYRLLPLLALIWAPMSLLEGFPMFIDDVSISPDPVTAGNSVTVDVALSYYYGDSGIDGFWWNLAGVSWGYVSTNATGDGSFTCTPPGAGTYWVRITPVDTNSVEYTTEDFSFTSVAPNAAPTISSMSHSPSSPLTGNSVTVTITGADANGIADLRRTYTWYRKPSGSTVSGSFGYVSHASDKTTTYSFTPTEVGTYTVYSYFEDDHGAESSTSSLSITVAAPNNPPTVNSISPSRSPGVVGTSTTFTVTCSDPDGVADLNRVVRSITTPGGATVASGISYFSHSSDDDITFSYTPTSSGNYTIRATAYDDDSGASSTSTRSWTVEAAPVAPTVTSISASSTVSQGSSVTVTVKADDGNGDSDLNRIYRYVKQPNGTIISSGNIAFSYNSDTVSFSFTASYPGTYTIYAKAYDDGGLSSGYSTKTVFSNATPYITGVNVNPSPTDTGTPVTVTVTAADGNDIPDLYRIRRYVKQPNGTDIAVGYSYVSNTLDNTMDFTFTPTQVGTHTIYAKVYDDRGAVSGYTTTSLTVTAPNAAPSISMSVNEGRTSINMPFDSTEIAYIPVTLNLGDAGEGDLVSLILNKDGSTVDTRTFSPASEGGTHYLWFTVPSGFSGTSSLVATVTDSGGKTAQASGTFTVTRTPPPTGVEFYVKLESGMSLDPNTASTYTLEGDWYYSTDRVNWTSGMLFKPALADLMLDERGHLFHDRIEAMTFNAIGSPPDDANTYLCAFEPHSEYGVTVIQMDPLPNYSGFQDLGDGLTVSYLLTSEQSAAGNIFGTPVAKQFSYEWTIEVGGDSAALLPPDIAVGQVWTDQYYMVTYTNQDPNGDKPYLQWYSRYYDDATGLWVEYELPESHWTDPTGWGVTNEYFGWSKVAAPPSSYYEIWARTFTLSPDNESQWVVYAGRFEDRPLRHAHALTSTDGATTFATDTEIAFEHTSFLLNASVLSNITDGGASDADVGYARVSYRLTDKDGTVGAWTTLYENTDTAGAVSMGGSGFAVTATPTTTTIEIKIMSQEIAAINDADTRNILTETFTYTRDANRPPVVTWLDGYDTGEGVYDRHINLNDTQSLTVSVWCDDPDDNIALIRCQVFYVDEDTGQGPLLATFEENLPTGDATFAQFELLLDVPTPGKYAVLAFAQDHDGIWSEDGMLAHFMAAKPSAYIDQASLDGADLLTDTDIDVGYKAWDPCGWDVTITDVSFSIPAKHAAGELVGGSSTGLNFGTTEGTDTKTWKWGVENGQRDSMSLAQLRQYIGTLPYAATVTVTNSLGMTSTLPSPVTILMSDPYRDADVQPEHTCNRFAALPDGEMFGEWFATSEAGVDLAEVAYDGNWKDATVPDVFVNKVDPATYEMQRHPRMMDDKFKDLWDAIVDKSDLRVKYASKGDMAGGGTVFDETTKDTVEPSKSRTTMNWDNLSPTP
jgi:hypothetical protein